MKKLQKYGFILIAILFMLFLAINMMSIPTYAKETSNNDVETKTFSDASLEEDFDESSVLVVLDKNTGGLNKKIEKKLFKNIQIKSIQDLTAITNINNNYLDVDNFHQILKIELQSESKDNVLQTIKQIEKIKGVLHAEPNYNINTGAQPTAAAGDQYPSLWGLHGTNGIKAEEAWNITTGIRSNVRVGVMDTGIANHPDLNANLVPGWDFYNNNSVTNDDPTGHGTHVAGTIGATGSNLNGVSGVAWNVQLVPLQVVKSDEPIKMPGDACISAFSWAASNNVDIINISAWDFANSAPFRNAIANYKGLIICIAGNANNNNDDVPNYLSNYSNGYAFSDRIISVGAIAQNGEKRWSSNYGKQSVSIFAPGENILSTSPFGAGYATMSGTSMAAPHVAGVAALMLSYNTYLTPAEIKTAIMANDDDLSSLSELCVSGGRVNAYKALSSLHKTQEVFNDFGYTGSTYHWHGAVRMNYDGDDAQNTLDGLKVIDKTQLEFELMTLSSSNAISTINGTINFELKNSAGASIQTHTSTVNVSAFNNIELGNNTFTINTFNLENGTYTLTFKSNFNRAFWSESIEKTYTFVVNQPTKVIGDFGYTTSWYRWNGKVDLQSDSLHLFTTNSSNQLVVDRGTNLNFTLGTDFAYNAWNEIVSTVTFKLRDSEGNTVNIGGNYSHTSTVRVGIVSNVTFTNRSFSLNAGSLPNDTYTLTLDNTSTRNGETYTQTNTFYILEGNFNLGRFSGKIALQQPN